MQTLWQGWFYTANNIDEINQISKDDLKPKEAVQWNQILIKYLLNLICNKLIRIL